MRKPAKPKRFVGKLKMELDFIRVETTVRDCRELFPLRDKIIAAVGEIMKDHPYIGLWGTGVRPMPKGVSYRDEATALLGTTDNGGVDG